MKYILNIRGTNGSGKSTIPMSMLDDPDMYVITKPYQGKPTKIATVFPNYGWVVLGTYFNKTGGLDCLKNNGITQKAFWYVLKKYPEYNLLMEGIISSTIFSTYLELFTNAQDRYTDLQVIVLELTTPVKICLDRIQQRNGGKPIKEELVIAKQKTIHRACEKLETAGIEVIRWDNSTQKTPVGFKKYPQIYKLIQHSKLRK